MDKGMEALREAVRRAPLTKPEGLSPEWQAYFDAVTPLHVAELIAALEQAQQENKVQSETIASVTELWNEQRNRLKEHEAAPSAMMQLCHKEVYAA